MYTSSYLGLENVSDQSVYAKFGGHVFHCLPVWKCPANNNNAQYTAKIYLFNGQNVKKKKEKRNKQNFVYSADQFYILFVNMVNAQHNVFDFFFFSNCL